MALACLWLCSCHTADTASEKASLQLQTQLKAPSLSCRCCPTGVTPQIAPWNAGLKSCHLLAYGVDWALKPPIVAVIFSCLILQWIYSDPDWPGYQNNLTNFLHCVSGLCLFCHYPWPLHFHHEEKSHATIMRSLLWKVIPYVDVSVITVLGPRLLRGINEGSEVEGWSRKAEEQLACDAERWITFCR